MRRYSQVLGAPGVLRLIASALLGRLPFGMSSLALLLFARSRGYSFGVAAATVGAFSLTNALASPVIGRAVDRFGQLPVLASTTCGEVVALGLLALGVTAGAPGALVAHAAVCGMLVPPISPCARGIISTLPVEPAGREQLFALDSISTEVVGTIGPLLVAAVIALTSPAGAIAATALLTAGGTSWLMTSRLSREWRPAARGRQSALTSRSMRTLLLPIAIGGCSIGATQVALAAIGSELHIPGSAGVLLALWCVGSLLGGLWYGGRAWSSAAQERYSALLVMMAASAAPLLVVRSMPGQYPLALLAGVAVAPMIAAQNALVAFLAPAYAITEAFTWSTAAIYAGIAGGEVAAGWLVDRAGPHAAVTISCVSACLAALVAVALRERLTRPARS